LRRQCLAQFILMLPEAALDAAGLQMRSAAGIQTFAVRADMHA